MFNEYRSNVAALAKCTGVSPWYGYAFARKVSVFDKKKSLRKLPFLVDLN